jgi:hypothetical protein
MYDSNTDLMVQVTNKNISYSKGKLFGWQDSTKEEFEETYQKLLKKIDDFVKQ